MSENGQSRRSLLKRSLVLGAGALGLGAVASDANAGLPGVLDPSGGELRLFGRNWRLETPGRRAGEAIQAGDHGALYGELLDGRKGRVIGHFYGSRLAMHANTGVEVHTFVLPDGTIVGMGTSVLGEAVFAVVGGTGVYAGAKGSYAALQRLREQGGNGTAEFKLTLRS